MEKAYDFVKKISNTSYVKGTSSKIEVISHRMPMFRTKETEMLFEKLKRNSLANGLGDLVPVESGGGSDSAYTQLAGVPSVCALGTCGDFCHTEKEYAEITSLVKRAKLLATTILS